MNAGVILSSENGKYFMADTPIQFRPLKGKALISYSIEAFKKAKSIDEIVVVAAANYHEHLRVTYGVTCIDGGKTHSDAVASTLDYFAAKTPLCQKIIFSDALRPFITPDLIDRYMMLLKEFDAVYTAQHMPDAVNVPGEGSVDSNRANFMQMPEAFRFGLIPGFFNRDNNFQCISQQLPPDMRTHRYYGFDHNIKVLNPEDFAMAEGLMNYLK